MENIFTTINLEPKYVEDVILAALILHNALIKSPNSVNVYHTASFADCVLEDGEVSEVKWCTNVVTDSFYSLQIPQMGHNASLYQKSVREMFMDYFVNDRAVEWQWKYCSETVVNFYFKRFYFKRFSY